MAVTRASYDAGRQQALNVVRMPRAASASAELVAIARAALANPAYEAGEIARVVITLDGRKLETETLSPPEVQFERVLNQIGGAGPGQRHVLTVKATNTDGDTRVASRRWNDVS